MCVLAPKAVCSSAARCYVIVLRSIDLSVEMHLFYRLSLQKCNTKIFKSRRVGLYCFIFQLYLLTGGCCRLCGSVEHYRKDCPENQNLGEVQEVA